MPQQAYEAAGAILRAGMVLQIRHEFSTFCVVYPGGVPSSMLNEKRIALAGAYWVAVTATFVLSEHQIVPGIWLLLVTLPWSFLPALVFFCAFFFGNADEWSSQALTQFDFVVLVVLCGGLNALLIAGVVKIGKGRMEWHTTSS